MLTDGRQQAGSEGRFALRAQGPHQQQGAADGVQSEQPGADDAVGFDVQEEDRHQAGQAAGDAHRVKTAAEFQEFAVGEVERIAHQGADQERVATQMRGSQGRDEILGDDRGNGADAEDQDPDGGGDHECRQPAEGVGRTAGGAGHPGKDQANSNVAMFFHGQRPCVSVQAGEVVLDERQLHGGLFDGFLEGERVDGEPEPDEGGGDHDPEGGVNLESPANQEASRLDAAIALVLPEQNS